MGKRSYLLDYYLLLSGKALVDTLIWDLLYTSNIYDTSSDLGETLYHVVTYNDDCRLENL